MCIFAIATHCKPISSGSSLSSVTFQVNLEPGTTEDFSQKKPKFDI